MIKILLVTSEREPFSEFARVLKQKDDIELTWTETGQEALEAISDNPVDLVIVNENIGDMTGIEFMKKLLPINPMINSAAVSPLSPEEFHEASEGLGVLVQLPVDPGKFEAEDLLKRLKNLKDFTAGIKIGVHLNE
ncbi:MAG: response regulator [Deltaproteobacteria bacterium]|nr:response regulator [Deltaproteobacteria bacterium]MBW1746966.1 response regulator [Deltaproteobacteria bacterium]MBW1825537.1 response regulator [Deltaproteobacteria bacterium]MBW1969074.1 response regulator [Deltaproteobacteria bacterium]MBW2157249.1 response regulator [Deltaproteobacteria bacterium]